MYFTGRMESPVMSHEDSEAVYKVMDEVRMQIGLGYKEDDWS